MLRAGLGGQPLPRAGPGVRPPPFLPLPPPLPPTLTLEDVGDVAGAGAAYGSTTPSNSSAGRWWHAPRAELVFLAPDAEAFHVLLDDEEIDRAPLVAYSRLRRDDDKI